MADVVFRVKGQWRIGIDAQPARIAHTHSTFGIVSHPSDGGLYAFHCLTRLSEEYTDVQRHRTIIVLHQAIKYIGDVFYSKVLLMYLEYAFIKTIDRESWQVTVRL